MTAVARPVQHGDHRRAAAVRAVGAAGPSLLAAALALIALAAGWHGTDLASAVYRVDQVRAHGLVWWDNGWYAGNYPLAYSALFPLLGAAVGLPVLGVVCVAGAAFCFDRLVTGWWGRRPAGSWYFAASTLLTVAIGQFPFLTGEALGLAALLALRGRRHGLAVALGVAAGLCSGVAAVFLAVAVGGWLLAGRRPRARVVAVAAVPVAVVGALELAFPGTGRFPYPFGGALLALAVAALAATAPVRRAPAVRAAAALYAVLVVGAFVVPSPLGGNVSRLAQAFGVPLLVCFALGAGRVRLRGGGRSGLVALVAIVPLALWQWGPGLDVLSAAASGPATGRTFYQPLLTELAALHTGVVRIEVPPTRQHWEAAYLAPHVALARGWERQLDIADDPLFYRSGPIPAGAYLRWLQANGVSYVALPAAPLDYAGTAEGRLLRARTVPGLRPVWRDRTWRLWQVTGGPGLVDGPGRVTALGPDRLAVRLTRPATVTVRVRWTRAWSVDTPGACVAPGPGGWTEVRAARAGTVSLAVSVLGAHHPPCPAG